MRTTEQDPQRRAPAGAAVGLGPVACTRGRSGAVAAATKAVAPQTSHRLIATPPCIYLPVYLAGRSREVAEVVRQRNQRAGLRHGARGTWCKAHKARAQAGRVLSGAYWQEWVSPWLPQQRFP
jgi:hypothetical protein